MSIEVSVIMISHNKYPQNLYSLYALENQTFDLQQMEVILVDDASADRTVELKDYQPPFAFRYIRCEPNVGRSRAKNIGIKAAAGNVLIFIDAEMILDPKYVEQHVKLHQADPNLVVTGCYNHYNTYTVYDPSYNPKQLQQLKEMYGRRNSRPLRIQKFKRNAKTRFFKKANIFALNYKKYAYHAPFFRSIIQRYGTNYKHFHLPYIFVITHNISVLKSTVERVGPFDEGFQGWGCEDWEFGYRLYKNGVKIIDNPHVEVYHQEHPRKAGNLKKDGLMNYRFFYAKHREIDVGAQALCWVGFNMLKVNRFVAEYKRLIRYHPHSFPHLTEAFLILFDLILDLRYRNLPVRNLRRYSRRLREKQWNEALQAEIKPLVSTGSYGRLITTLNWLLKR